MENRYTDIQIKVFLILKGLKVSPILSFNWFFAFQSVIVRNNPLASKKEPYNLYNMPNWFHDENQF